MARVHVLFWFDVEDCTVPLSDDAARQLAMILSRNGVRGTFKVVGQKARVLEQRVRYKVIDELQKHDVGFHSNWHGLRPQIAEYMASLTWEEGVAEFEARESPGLADVRRLFGVEVTTYGQPGSNWVPQAFPVLQKWNIPTYVSGFGYVGVDCQPFWYGGVLCTSHLYGKRLDGREQRHHMGLNFELGQPGAIDAHKKAFARSLAELGDTGGLISIINHPCTLVLEEWFSSRLKPRELTEAGYAHFEQFVQWAMAHENVTDTSAAKLLALYPDRALGKLFGHDELHVLAQSLTDSICFQRFGDMTLSAAEAFGMLVNGLASYVVNRTLPLGTVCSAVANPALHPNSAARDLTVPWEVFCDTTRRCAEYLATYHRVPDYVEVAGEGVAPADYLATVAGVVRDVMDGKALPHDITLTQAHCDFEQYVDENAARSAWRSAMMPDGFAAPRLYELAKLGAWTLKPAVLASVE